MVGMQKLLKLLPQLSVLLLSVDGRGVGCEGNTWLCCGTLHTTPSPTPTQPHLLKAFGLAPLCSTGSDSLEFSLFCKSTIIYR